MIPNLWQKTITMHDFNPLIHSPMEFTHFCERIQFAEGINPHSEKVSHTKLSTSPLGGKSCAANKNKKLNCKSILQLQANSANITKPVHILLENVKPFWPKLKR